MSRFAKESPCGRYKLIFGNDHVLGRFIQLMDRQDRTLMNEGYTFEFCETFGVEINKVFQQKDNSIEENKFNFDYWLEVVKKHIKLDYEAN